MSSTSITLSISTVFISNAIWWSLYSLLQKTKFIQQDDNYKVLYECSVLKFKIKKFDMKIEFGHRNFP